jgi:hypothetical protein
LEFLHLPPYKDYQSQWINLAAVESIYKLHDEQVCINYRSGKKQVYSGIWAKVIVDYLGESKFIEAMNNYFPE